MIDLRKIGRLDFTGVQTLRDLAADATSAGLSVRLIPGHAIQGTKVLKRVIGEDSKYFATDQEVKIDNDDGPPATTEK